MPKHNRTATTSINILEQDEMPKRKRTAVTKAESKIVVLSLPHELLQRFPHSTKACKRQNHQASKQREAAEPIVAGQSSKCLLLALPQELQDMTFDFAYPGTAHPKFVEPKEWQTRAQRFRLGKAEYAKYAQQPYPGHKVNEFLVSKQYFVNAAKTYVQNQGIGAGKRFNYEQPWSMLDRGIGMAYLTKLWVKPYQLCHVSSHPNLRSLTLELDEYDFVNVIGRHPCLDQLIEEDFLSVPDIQCLLEIRGLQEFKIEAEKVLRDSEDSKSEDKDEDVSAAKAACLKANVERIEEFVLERVSQPKEAAPGSSTSRVPLYAGSRVALQGSALLKPTSVGLWFRAGSGNSNAVQQPDFENDGMPPRKRARIEAALHDADVPDDVEGVLGVMRNNPMAVAEWIINAKPRLRSVE